MKTVYFLRKYLFESGLSVRKIIGKLGGLINGKGRFKSKTL